MKKLLFVFLFILMSYAVVHAQGITDTIKLDPVEIMDQAIRRITYLKNTVLKSSYEDNAVRDIGDLLRTIPNVSGLRKGGVNIDPVVRGFKFSQLLTLVNGSIGIEGGCPNRMDPSSSHVDVDDIESIEVIKGPHALRYGPVFGGVVILNTQQPKPFEKFEMHARAIGSYETNWGGHKEHVTINGGNKKVYFLLSGNQLVYGDYEDGNGNTLLSSFKKYSYSAKLGFTPAKKHYFLLNYMGSKHRNVRFPALQMDEREDNTSIYGFSYVTKGYKGIFSGASLKASYAMVDHVMDNKWRSNGDTVVAVSDVDANTLGIRGGVDLNFKDRYFLFIGGDFQYITKDGDRTKVMIMQPVYNGMIPTKVEALWNDAWVRNIGIYSEFKTTLGTFDLVGAVRLDLNHADSKPIELYGSSSPGTTPPLLLYNDTTESDFINFGFSLGATKRFGKKMSLSLSAGRGSRSPNLLERFIILLPVGYDNYEYMGNPQLKPETNNEIDLTFKHNCDKSGAFEFNIFYSLVENFIMGRRIPSSVQKPLTMNVLGVKEFYNAGNASFMGFELGYTTPEAYRWGVKLTAAYTYATLAEVTKQVLDPTKIISQQVIGEEVLKNDAVPEIPPLEANLMVHYRFCKGKLIPKASVRMVLDQGHVSDAFYEPATPGFVLLNLGLTYKYNQFITLSGGVNNLLDQAYYEHLNRKIIGTKGKLYEPGRVFFVNLMFNL